MSARWLCVVCSGPRTVSASDRRCLSQAAWGKSTAATEVVVGVFASVKAFEVTPES
jgi:hypothetical protein